MLHICFDESAYCTVRHAMKLGVIEKEKVALFDDDLSVGNILNCREYESRKDVLYNIFHDDITHMNDSDVKKKFDDFYKRLLKDNNFIIWYADNPKDYCNLYYVVSLLKDKNIKVVECIKKALREKTMYYNWVGQIAPKDLPMFLKEARELNEEEKNKYSEQWELLVLENGLLRAEVSGDIKTVTESYYDNLILKRVPIKNIRIARVVGDFIGHDKPCLRSWFVIWRIKHLEEVGYVEINYRCDDSFMFNDIRKLV